MNVCSFFLINILLSIVSGIWAKKNAVRKEEVAKLVDDTYRCVCVPHCVALAYM